MPSRRFSRFSFTRWTFALTRIVKILVFSNWFIFQGDACRTSQGDQLLLSVDVAVPIITFCHSSDSPLKLPRAISYVSNGEKKLLKDCRANLASHANGKE